MYEFRLRISSSLKGFLIFDFDLRKYLTFGRIIQIEFMYLQNGILLTSVIERKERILLEVCDRTNNIECMGTTGTEGLRISWKVETSSRR